MKKLLIEKKSFGSEECEYVVFAFIFDSLYLSSSFDHITCHRVWSRVKGTFEETVYVVITMGLSTRTLDHDASSRRF